jgi:hypothetical protein
MIRAGRLRGRRRRRRRRRRWVDDLALARGRLRIRRGHNRLRVRRGCLGWRVRRRLRRRLVRGRRHVDGVASGDVVGPGCIGGAEKEAAGEEREDHDEDDQPGRSQPAAAASDPPFSAHRAAIQPRVNGITPRTVSENQPFSGFGELAIEAKSVASRGMRGGGDSA